MTSGSAGWSLGSGTTARSLSAAFGPRKEMLVTGSADYSAQTSGLAPRQASARPPSHGAFRALVDVAVSPNGEYVATASADGTGRIWDVATGRGDVAQLTGHRNHLRTIAFSPRGLHVVTSSRDGTVRVWK